MVNNIIPEQERMSTSYQSHQTCLISGDKQLKPLNGYEQHYLVKSKKTGFVFCSRIPTETELINHYNQYTRNNFISPITVKNYQDLLTSFEPYRKTGRILDIGCGDGYFLEEARKMGWEVYGTEYTDDAIEVCKEKGIQMHQGKLTPTNYDADSFDVITSFEVIEHINNPIEEVQNIRSILRKGGIFYLTTPNFNAIERYILKKDYNIITYPEHLSYYTPKTINYLLSNNGFRKKKILTTGISLTRLKTSMAVSDEALISETSTDEKLRGQIQGSPVLGAVKNMVNNFLTLTGVGNSLKAYFIKE